MYSQFKFLWLFLFAGLACTPHAISKGENIVHHNVGGMEIDVYLPPGYDASKSYKTLYFNDGETIFQRGFGWELHEKLDDLISDTVIEPILGVAIYTQGKRLDWYNPYQDNWIQENWGRYTPQAAAYTNTLVQEIIPFIEKNYAAGKDAKDRGMAGYSMGGLHAAWAALQYPAVFGFSAALSPSFWVADHAIFADVKTKKAAQRYWFDIGTGEWEYYVPFYVKLQEAGHEAGTSAFYYEVKGGRHVSEDWLQRIDLPLRVFAGVNRDFSPKSMEVWVACIPSASIAGKVYRRVSAQLTLTNGIKHTLSNKAVYTLQKGDIQLYEDGTFLAGSQKTATVQVKYPGFEKTLTFRVEDCK